MNVKKRNWLLLLLAVVLIFSASVSSAMAYFTGYTQIDGRRKIEFKGPPELHEDFKDWVKDVTITNTKGQDIFVRARAFKGDDITLEYDPGAGWSYNSGDGWWYYEPALAAGETTSVLLITIKDIPADVEDGANFNVAVVFEATPVQYNEDGSTFADWSLKLEETGGGNG